MWFGNLVTMRWWDDLWLNESFATYIATSRMTEATRFTNAWKVFNADIKRWAYQQDQLPTTHPIAGAADDTEIAFLNFDGITYGKGASVLKQLVKYIGRDAFRDGLRIYFRRYAWSQRDAATTSCAALEESSGASLQRVGAAVARDARRSTRCRPTGRPTAADLTAMAIQQTASEEYPTLRPHALEMALAKDGDGRLARSSRSRRGSTDPTRRSPRRAARNCRTSSSRTTATTPTPRSSLDPASLDYVRTRLDQRRRRAAARAALDVAVGDGPRPRAALDRVPGHLPQRAARRAPISTSSTRSSTARRCADRRSLPAGVDPRGRGAHLVRGAHSTNLKRGQ